MMIARNMSVWGKVRSIFKPQFKAPFVPSMFEGQPDQVRKERPMRSVTRTRWFQSDVEEAIIAADLGNLKAAGNANEALMRDGTFAGLMSTRAGGLLRLPRIFRGTAAVVADLETTDDGTGLFDRVFPPAELESFEADAICIGIAIGEMVPIPDQDEPIFVRLDPQFLVYRFEEDRWYYSSIGGMLPVTPGDGRWVLHTYGGYLNPWRRGLWAGAMRAFVAKEHAYLYRENFSGKLANPARVAKSPLGATDSQNLDMLTNLIRWGVNTCFTLPQGWDVDIIESNGRGYEVFQQTIESSDQEFMIMIAGQLVTVTGGAGFANANIHATIRSDLIQKDGILLAATLNEQALRPLINLLYGCGSSGTIAWDTTPPIDLKAKADAFTAAAGAISSLNEALAPYGEKVDARELVKSYKIPTYPMSLMSIDGDGTLSDEDAEILALDMTEKEIPRCEHGSSNRCRMCGVERKRIPKVTGKDELGRPIVEWAVAWKVIPKVAQ